MTELLGIVAVAIVAWFAIGTIVNVRRASAAMRWMQDGLPLLGGRTTLRWLGSTAVELTIRDALPPFSAATVVVFLEARDMPWMWALGRGRGRRDTLIVRGALRRAPAAELEAVDPASWSGREALPRIPREWPVRGAEDRAGACIVHHATPAALARADALLEAAARARLAVRRLSVRAAPPNFQLHADLPAGDTPARELFEAVRALAELASG